MSQAFQHSAVYELGGVHFYAYYAGDTHGSKMNTHQVNNALTTHKEYKRIVLEVLRTFPEYNDIYHVCVARYLGVFPAGRLYGLFNFIKGLPWYEDACAACAEVYNGHVPATKGEHTSFLVRKKNV